MGTITNKEGEPLGFYMDKDKAFDLNKADMLAQYDKEMYPSKMYTPHDYGADCKTSPPLLAGGRKAKIEIEDIRWGDGPESRDSIPGYPNTLDDLMDYVLGFHHQCRDIMMNKNQRYANSKDPFSNFHLGGEFGVCVRMTDKVSRLMQLLHPSNKNLDSLDESVEDTCKDLANYAALLCAMRQHNGSGK